jgi:hypothetical protein
VTVICKPADPETGSGGAVPRLPGASFPALPGPSPADFRTKLQRRAELIRLRRETSETEVEIHSVPVGPGVCRRTLHPRRIARNLPVGDFHNPRKSMTSSEQPPSVRLQAHLQELTLLSHQDSLPAARASVKAALIRAFSSSTDFDA